MNPNLFLRPLSAASQFTCDWGHCDGEAVAERWCAHEGAWLSVCARCRKHVAGHEDHPPTAVEVGSWWHQFVIWLRGLVSHRGEDR